jgi:hypothetical protein
MTGEGAMLEVNIRKESKIVTRLELVFGNETDTETFGTILLRASKELVLRPKEHDMLHDIYSVLLPEPPKPRSRIVMDEATELSGIHFMPAESPHDRRVPRMPCDRNPNLKAGD